MACTWACWEQPVDAVAVQSSVPLLLPLLGDVVEETWPVLVVWHGVNHLTSLKPS